MIEKTIIKNIGLISHYSIDFNHNKYFLFLLPTIKLLNLILAISTKLISDTIKQKISKNPKWQL